MQLKKTVNQAELVAVIALQIQDLLDFLGMEMTSKQVVDTAEFILEKHAFFSIRGLQHCFNMIKNSEPPFNKPLYNKVTGRKILDWLHEYDKLVDEHLFADANNKVSHDEFRGFYQNRNKADKLFNVAGAMSMLKQEVKNKKLNNK